MDRSSLIGFATRVFRGYVRYTPWAFGKSFLFEHVFNPYLFWRRYSTVAKTRFGARMALCLPDVIQSRIYFFGFWEPHLTHFVGKSLSKGDYFVDVGANIGYFSLLASSLVGTTGKVFSVEASPSIFRLLQENALLNRAENIQLFHMAASDQEGMLPIYLGNVENIGSTTTVSSIAESNGQKLEAQVPAKKLADIIGYENLLKARLIKIDVEGAETLVIQGIREVLDSFSERTEWVIEISPDPSGTNRGKIAELLTSFTDAGYGLYQLTNDYRLESYISPVKDFTLTELHDVTDMVDMLATKRRPEASRFSSSFSTASVTSI